jgi:hypothetical protein
MLGGLTNISLDFGADLDRAIFRFGPHIPKPGPATINSALLHHRAAFGRPFGDPDETIKNLRRRYFYRYLSIAHLFWPLINQAHRVADEARSRGWSPFALLVSKPEWAAGFLRTAEDFEQIVPTLMLELGVGGFAVEHLVRVRAASP